MSTIEYILLICDSKMGCCCLQRISQDQDGQGERINDNSSWLEQDKKKGSEYWRNQGKIFYNSKQYQRAISAYQKALEYDSRNLVNYTNLALSYKAQEKFYQSIETIDSMTGISFYELDSQKIIIKGKIIRARCQTILVRNFCVESEEKQMERPNSLAQAQTLIQCAVTVLRKIAEDEDSKLSMASFNVNQFLKNAKKVQQFLNLLGKKSSEKDILFEYLTKRLKQPEAEKPQNLKKIQKYAQNPLQIIPMLAKWSHNNQKLEITDHESDEQFIIDPITYEQLCRPIIVKSGISYEESVLKQHYEKNGTHDPITRQQLGRELGVANRCLSALISSIRVPVNRDDIIFRQY